MGAAHRKRAPLGRDLAIWEIHLRSTGKSPHTGEVVHPERPRAGGWLTDAGLPVGPERTTTSHLREFQAHLLLPEDHGGAGLRSST